MSGEHGTYSGYQRHKLAKEDACDPCKAANRAYQTEYRARLRPIRCVRGLGWPEAGSSSWRWRGKSGADKRA